MFTAALGLFLGISMHTVAQACKRPIVECTRVLCRCRKGAAAGGQRSCRAGFDPHSEGSVPHVTPLIALPANFPAHKTPQRIV